MELQRAEKISVQLFEAVEKNNLMVPGKSEKQLNEEISKLALRKFGIEKYWHKKIVRGGKNTISINNDNPTDRLLEKEHILFIYYGIITDGWESDLGLTDGIGDGAKKTK